MLVLTREIQQRILITAPNGDRIMITLCDIPDNSHARIGIEASQDYRITRPEKTGVEPCEAPR